MCTTEDQTYNGWTNYATWGVNLILSNDQGLYETVTEQARFAKETGANSEQVEQGIWTPEQSAQFWLEDWLKDYTENLCGFESDYEIQQPSAMASQLIYAGLADVNWAEIAKAWLSES